jgi:glyoxylase-like metal-dependent hydrolase (beta-lactamase superfamily II)
VKAWSIEGNTQRLDGGAMFGNVPRALWQKWLPPDEQHRVPLACRALLVQLDDGRRVLFETGIGAFFDPAMRERFGVVEAEHRLLRSLAEIGLSDADIDVVVLSHLHFDHAGGLLAPFAPGEPLRLLFPKARFVVAREHFERAEKPHPRDRASFIPGLNALLHASGRLELVELGPAQSLSLEQPVPATTACLGEAVHFFLSDGHTPGLMLSEVRGERGIVFCADLIPGRPWVHVPVTMGYDRFPERLIDEKRRFLEDRHARGVRLFFTHDADIALADIARSADGKFSTANEQPAVVGAAV